MTSTIDKCLEFVNLRSLDEKKEQLKMLKILTNDDNNQGSVISDDPNNSAKPTTRDNADYEKLVSYHSSFLGDESFLEQCMFSELRGTIRFFWYPTCLP